MDYEITKQRRQLWKVLFEFTFFLVKLKKKRMIGYWYGSREPKKATVESKLKMYLYLLYSKAESCTIKFEFVKINYFLFSFVSQLRNGEIAICDLKNLKFSSLLKSNQKEVISVLQNAFPNRMRFTIDINH